MNNTLTMILCDMTDSRKDFVLVKLKMKTYVIIN